MSLVIMMTSTSMMQYAVLVLLFQIWVVAIRCEDMTDSIVKSDDAKIGNSESCLNKEGCCISYKGRNKKEICDVHCSPLRCVWLSVENSTHMFIQCGKKSPKIPKEKALEFLHERRKRSIFWELEEECREGCKWEEVKEVKSGGESIMEYMRWYVCNRRSQCPSGQYCSVTGTYGNSNNLKVTCSVDGAWSNWNSWSACSVTCETGTKIRYRQCDNPSPIGNGLSCAGGNSATTSCRPCNDISNCQISCCNSAVPALCLKCSDLDLYKLDEADSKCTRKCSWENRWCWPGTCNGDYARTCSCAAGFTRYYDSTRAICQPYLLPNITSCSMRVTASSGDSRISPFVGSSHCDNQQDFYGNFQVDSILTSSTFDYIIDVTHVPRPAFVISDAFGITDVQIHTVIKRVIGFETVLNTLTVLSDPDSDFPRSTYSPMDQTIAFPNVLSDGQRLCLRFHPKAGGHFTSKNIQNHITSTERYTKTEHHRDLCYIYDNASPEHCSVSSSCLNEPLTASPRVTRERMIQVSISGWLDPFPFGGNSVHSSGIESFILTIHDVKERDSYNLFMDSAKADGTTDIYMVQNSETTILLPDHEPAVYGLLLEVKDVANNVRQSRRFVLYDNSSVIAIDSNYNLFIVSAAENTNFTWQISHSSICVSWRDRYYNNKFLQFNPLRPIDVDSHGLVQPDYDQTTGTLPITGTSNVHGISQFDYELIQETADYNITVSSNSISDVSSQNVCIPHTVYDGDIFRFELRASDIVGNSFQESIRFFIDTSPPVISNAWLVRDGHQQLFVHNSTDLFRMLLEFDSYDTHSGLIQILWWFYETDPERLLGQGSVGVRSTNDETSCPESQLCICAIAGNCQFSHFSFDLNVLTLNNNHSGNHNRMYRYDIEVTNAARLKTSISVDVHVDESPPEEGVVYEGFGDQADIDYTSESYIPVRWHGFIDHESGIEFYRVALSTSCLQKDDMISSQNSNEYTYYRNTTSTSTQFEIPALGKYFVTVIAFNRAMEPSAAVCSDGFTKSDSAPEIVNVTLSKARTRTCIACFNGDMWLVSEKLTRTNITGESSCSVPCSEATGGFDLNMLPLAISQSDSTDACSVSCPHNIYLPMDIILLSWAFPDNIIPIDVVSVGFGSTILSAVSPDLQDFESVHQHTFFRRHHIGFTSGIQIYIFIKAVNKAGRSSTVAFGPVVIDESAPICPSSIPISQNTSHAVVSLHQNMFTDDEQREDVSSIVYRIRFEKKNGILSYSSWETFDTASCVNISECLTFSHEYLLYLIVGVDFPLHIELHVYNIAGHHCTVLSEAFYISAFYKPTIGTVKDIQPGITAEPFADQDVSFSLSEYCVAWAGVSDHMTSVTIEVGLGSSPENDDIVHFQTADGHSLHCQNNVALEKNNSYYAVLRVNNSAGTSRASSDGFKVLSDDDVLNAISVFDGPGCGNMTFVCQWTLQSNGNNTQLQASCDQILHVANQYTLQYPKELQSVISITSDDVLFIENRPGSITFSPFVHRPVFAINCLIENMTGVSFFVFRCQEDIDYHYAGTPMSVNWQVNGYADYITHFEISLFSNESGGNSSSVIETAITTADMRNITFTISVLDENIFFGEVKPCFGKKCLAGVVSDGFVLEFEAYIGSLTAVVLDYSNSCSTVNVSWSDAQCTNTIDASALFYRWRVAYTDDSLSSQCVWNTHIGKTTQHNEIANINLTADVFAQRFICLQTFCRSGQEITKCKQLQIEFHQNEFPKEVVYDVDVNSVNFHELQLLIFSSNIGEKLNYVHDIELDYSRNWLTLGAFMLGLQDRDVTWYLMTNSQIPNDTCASDINCILHEETNGGAVSFGKLNLNEGKYFICAKSEACNRTRKDIVEHFDKVEGCSDGVLIDETRPSPGSVILHSHDGYKSDSSELLVSWKDFHDNFASYGVGFLQYRYAIGSYPGGHDIQAYTEVGEEQSVLVRNESLTPGIVYYAIVEARDKVGFTTRVISDGVILDDTPPVSGKLFVGDLHVHRLVTIRQNLCVYWSGFFDNESGIKYFEVAIGSYSDTPDVASFLHIDPSAFSFDFSDLLLQHGHHYYAFLRVTNRAGLSVLAVSEYFILDDTSPLPGIVREGHSASGDLTYLHDLSYLVCSWEGFFDPESGVEHYKVGLGTEPSKLDVKPFTFVGLITNFTWSLPLEEGVTYFTIVQACNTGELCTDVTSNGVMVDHSPPIHGQVIVGQADRHQRYIGQRSHVEVFCVGFHDTHSDLDHYEVCISSKLNSDCDIYPLTNTHPSPEHLLTGLNLPIQSALYVTVWAYNKVGLSTNVTSDVFTVDATQPVCIQTPVFTSSTSVMPDATATQWDTSVVGISWLFEDEESPIIRHRISVRNHHNGHTYIEDVELLNENHTIILLKPEHWLLSGDRYQATVVACNAAGLCTSVSSGYLLVDSSPPHIGGFVDDMSWKFQNNRTTVNVTWSGFEDAESGIKSYYLTIGETYSGNELSLGKISFVHTGELHAVQYGYITINKQLLVDSKIILSLIAENNVGLVTSATRVTTRVLQTDMIGHTGSLKVEKHSCDVHYCNKDCTCAALGQKCSTIDANACNQTESFHYQNVSVFSGYDAGVHVLHSLSSACLAANWILSPVQHDFNVIRIEWSAGFENMAYGAGVFDRLKEDIWYDIGMQNNFVHCVNSNNSLLHSHRYVVYIRAWYDTNTYRIFSSQPLLIDRTSPKIAQGFHIKDSVDNCKTDVEFITERNFLTACWQNGFSDSQSGLLYYLTSLGTSPGAFDTSPVSNVGTVTNITWTALDLHPGSRYYVTVTAVNALHMLSTYTSDGFVVDTECPLSGTVFNTKHYKNHQSQCSTDTLEASWNGFMDRHSHIQFYKVATVDIGHNFSSLTYKSVGRKTRVTLQGLQLFAGQSYMIIVKAVDASGQESEAVYSHPILIDSTPPVAFQCAKYVTILDEIYDVNLTAVNKVWNIPLGGVSSVCRLLVTIQNSTEDTDLVLAINDHSFNAHLVRQSLTHVFTVHSEEQLVLSVKASDPMAALGNFTVVLQECNNVTSHNYSTHRIPLQQIAFSKVSAMLQFVDPESDIRTVELGVGTTLHGYQVKALEPVFTAGYHAFSVNLPHGTPVYATAVVENNAGLRAYFRSSPLIIDHTPPNITDARLQYNDASSGKVVINVTWEVDDPECQQVYCDVSFGLIWKSEEMTIDCKSEVTVGTEALNIPHGTRLTGVILCKNDAGIIHQTHTNDITVLLDPPGHRDSRITFLDTHGSTVSGQVVTRSGDRLLFHWDEFDYLAGDVTYQYRVDYLNGSKTSWINVGYRNFVTTNTLNIVEGSECGVEVRGSNDRGLVSGTINATIYVFRQPPSLTGTPCKFPVIRTGTVTLNCSLVFDVIDTLKTSYILTVGTELGFSDIVWYHAFDEDVFTFKIRNDVAELFVIVTAVYDTGTETTYTDRFPLIN